MSKSIIHSVLLGKTYLFFRSISVPFSASKFGFPAGLAVGGMPFFLLAFTLGLFVPLEDAKASKIVRKILFT